MTSPAYFVSITKSKSDSDKTNNHKQNKQTNKKSKAGIHDEPVTSSSTIQVDSLCWIFAIWRHSLENAARLSRFTLCDGCLATVCLREREESQTGWALTGCEQPCLRCAALTQATVWEHSEFILAGSFLLTPRYNTSFRVHRLLFPVSVYFSMYTFCG